MTTTIKISATAIKALLLLFALNFAFACSNTKSNTPSNDATTQTVASPTEKNAAESITITGIVKAITFGKDGYSADVQTDKDGLYAALVSISNLGGPDNYKTCEASDKVTFKGRPWGDKKLTVEQIISIEPMITQLLISPTSFRGIQVGDAISKHGDYAKKTKMKTGEGSFDAYEIRDFDNNPAGYFLPDPKNKLLVGDITVQTTKARTEKGIKVGDSFQALLKVFPNVEVHGSEIEGRTYATANGLSYRLDVPNFTYDVDKAKIPATTKITEIVINRGGTATQTTISATPFSQIKPNDYCWQTSKTLDLHTQPSAKSKVEGKHFAGEVLKVLGTKTVNNQLWVHVAYNFKIKAGYEDQFADGQVMPGGEPTGWIGGAETPKISCK